MSYLRSSQNYIWNTSAVLGKGATGAVYAGLHKSTGESVAVKSFNHLSHMRPYEVQRREFEVLKKVNHENIVRLLAIEEEVESQHKVLVMELCTGGSLFNILDDPVNCYGLEETEFLLVMKHLAAGMKHLRDNNIMHRDLKPGNIMKFIGEDGFSIYKLTDFGAARELEDDQQFQSLYGTEEYLHPDMYERAVLRKPAGKTFKANFDLWSIGVTLFHIATGSLPFKPYGGRKNKETMYRITTEKMSGIICGIQHSENGDIEWSRNLPKTCLLSPAAQQLVTKLLAGLMECQPVRMWTFDKFFESVTYILNHRVYHIYVVNSMRDVVVYMLPHESTNDLKIRLKANFSTHPEHQLLMWNNREVIDVRDVTTTSDKPMIMLSSDSAKIKQSPIKSLIAPKFPDLRISITNTDQDAQIAKLSSSTAFSVQRTVAKCVLYYNLARSTPNQVISFIQSNVTLLFEKQQVCLHFYNSLQTQFELLNTTSSNLMKLCDEVYDDQSGNLFALTSDAHQRFTQLKSYWTALSRKMVSLLLEMQT
jgi:TANK-binding kinase 1